MRQGGGVGVSTSVDLRNSLQHLVPEKTSSLSKNLHAVLFFALAA